MEFPVKGISAKEIDRRLEGKEKRLYPSGIEKILLGGCALTGLDDMKKVAVDAFLRFVDENVLNNTVPQQEMQQDVISMTGSLFGLKNAGGVNTAGGTESNILSLYVARNRAGRRGSVVMPSTAHPSLFKGCDWFGLEPIVVPTKKDFRADAQAMRRAVRKDTIAIIGTAGPWTLGVIDPIDEIGEIAEEKNLYFHVDASWGGLICPFLRYAGYDIPEFAFKIKAVCSVCADPHKQGYSLYPHGVIVFRDSELLKFAIWSHALDGGGKTEYTTGGLLGSRPVGPIAATWALFHYLGREGYTRLSKKCMELTEMWVKRINEIPGLLVAGEPKMNLTNCMSDGVNMVPVREALRKKGWDFWDLDSGIAVALVPFHEKGLPSFLDDLEKEVSKAPKLSRKL